MQVSCSFSAILSALPWQWIDVIARHLRYKLPCAETINTNKISLMSKRAEYRVLEAKLADQLKRLDSLKTDDALKSEIEFETTRRSLSILARP